MVQEAWPLLPVLLPLPPHSSLLSTPFFTHRVFPSRTPHLTVQYGTFPNKHTNTHRICSHIYCFLLEVMFRSQFDHFIGRALSGRTEDHSYLNSANQDQFPRAMSQPHPRLHGLRVAARAAVLDVENLRFSSTVSGAEGAVCPSPPLGLYSAAELCGRCWAVLIQADLWFYFPK